MSKKIPKLNKPKLFNPKGNDDISERKMVGGNSTNIIDLNNVKYKWSSALYRTMVANHWIPEKIGMEDDLRDIKKLTPAEYKGYSGILSFLVFLDSIQTNNLPNIFDFITAPEIKILGAIQTFQEAIHSQSYAYIIESIIPKSERAAIYENWRDDPVLFKRNQYIAQIYQDFVENQSYKNYIKVIIANYLLESLYFYNGFNFFYSLASRGMMINTSVEIRYINRDELTHVTLFKNIFMELKNEIPEIIDSMEDEIIKMFHIASEQEIEWSNHIIGDSILGINTNSTIEYTHYLTNKRLKDIGYEPIFEKSSNPYRHLEKIADAEGSGDVKSNQFESTSTSYQQKSVFSGWNKLDRKQKEK